MHLLQLGRRAFNRALRLRDLYGLRRFPRLSRYDLHELEQLNRCFVRPVIVEADAAARMGRARQRAAALARRTRLAGGCVLDVGCDSGELAFALLAQAQEVVGIDINVPALREGMCEQAQVANDGQARLVAGSASELPFASETFDLVVSYWTMEHIADYAAVLPEFRRVLKPGGRVYLDFGPLFYSPMGHHLYRFLGIPWVHLIFPEEVIFAHLHRLGQDWWANAYRDLNRLTVRRFRELVAESKLTVRDFRTSKMPLGRLPESMRCRLAGYTEEDLRTSSIVCLLEK